MNEPLKVETFRQGFGVKVWKVSGFTDEEYYKLIHEDYRDMKKDVLDMLDKRNGRLGTCWHNGYGVFDMYQHGGYPGCIFVETGNNCD